MPSLSSTPRETAARRTALAFEAARLRGWDRERILVELGISRATYYRLESERQRSTNPEPRD